MDVEPGGGKRPLREGMAKSRLPLLINAPHASAFCVADTHTAEREHLDVAKFYLMFRNRIVSIRYSYCVKKNWNPIFRIRRANILYRALSDQNQVGLTHYLKGLASTEIIINLAMRRLPVS